MASRESNHTRAKTVDEISTMHWGYSFLRNFLAGQPATSLDTGQYHLAVAGGCGASTSIVKASFAPTRYREVVLTRIQVCLIVLRTHPQLDSVYSLHTTSRCDRNHLRAP